MLDYYKKLTSEQRLGRVGHGSETVMEIYRDPKELIADLNVILGLLAAVREEKNNLAIDLRKVANARDTVTAEMSCALSKFSKLLPGNS